MRAFQVLSAVALVGSAVNGQYYTSGYRSYGVPSYSSYGSYGSYGLGLGGVYGTSYAPAVSYGASYGPAVSYGTRSVVAAPAVSYAARSVVAAPAVSYAARSVVAAPAVTTVHAAPAVAVAAPAVTRVHSVSTAPAVSYSTGYGVGGGVAYGAGAGGAIVTGNAGGIRSHEIHTGGAGNTIHVQEFKAGGQLVRVHDSPQQQTEVLNVQGPAATGNHIRLVSHSGPTQVQRTVHQDPNVQVFDVVNPPKPGDRVINIQKAPAPAAQVELVAEEHHSVPEITVGDGDAPNVEVQHVGGASLGGAAYSTGATYSTGAIVAPAVHTVHHAAPAVAVAAAPAVHTVHHAAPAVAVAAAPAVHTVHHAAPAVAVAAPAVTRVHTVSTAPAAAVSYRTGAVVAPVSYSTGLVTPSTSYSTGFVAPSYSTGFVAPSYSTSYGTSYGTTYGSTLGNTFGTTAVLKKKASA